MKIWLGSLVAVTALSAFATPYRFVAFNIWGNYFGNPPEGRAEVQAEILNDYAPDFIGLQEMTTDFWNSRLIADLTNRYETVGRGLGPDGIDAYVPVLYRRERFDLLATGAKWFCPELDRSKGVVWAALKDRVTGSNIVAFASHFWWRYDGAGDDFIRLDNARQLYAEVAAAAKQFDAAVVGGGDLNAGGVSSALRELNRLGWRDAQETTPGRDSRFTWHGEPERNWRTGRYEGVAAELSKKRPQSLDHVFYSPARVRAREFRVDTRKIALDVSDHSPIIFDFDVHGEIDGWQDPRKTQSLEPVPQSSDPNHAWMKRFRQKLGQCHTDREVVFIGGTAIGGWETTGRTQWERYFATAPFHAMNLGFADDRTEHVLWRLEQGMMDGYKAKVIVLMIGAKGPAIDGIIGVRAVVDAIRARQPDARIILTPASDPVVDAEIVRLADGKNVIWCELRDLMNDLAHPSAADYELWANAMLPIVKEILRTSPGAVIPGRYARNAAPGNSAAALPRPSRPMARFDISGTRGKWWWANRLMEKRNEIAASDGKYDLVMVGDSVTHFWEDFNWWTDGLDSFDALRSKCRVLNLGYGGDHTGNVLWRLGNGELDGYKTKWFMLMIGSNNNGDTPEDTAEGIKRILNLIARRHPESRTLLLPIFPRGKPGDRQRERIGKINALIRPFADGKRVVWLDFTREFLQPDGTFKPKVFIEDNLHPRYPGYEIWRKALEAALGLF